MWYNFFRGFFFQVFSESFLFILAGVDGGSRTLIAEVSGMILLFFQKLRSYIYNHCHHVY